LWEYDKTKNAFQSGLPAGAGSSEHIKTEDIILVDHSDIFVRRIAPNSWWGKFKTYLSEKYPNCTIVNNGCGGIYSSQVRNNLFKLHHKDRNL